MKIETKIGSALNSARKEVNINLRELSHQLDTTPQALSNIHSGFRGPSWGKLEDYLIAIGAKAKLVIEIPGEVIIESESFGVDF